MTLGLGLVVCQQAGCQVRNCIHESIEKEMVNVRMAPEPEKSSCYPKLDERE